MRLDCTSLNGGEPVVPSPAQVVAAWSRALSRLAVAPRVTRGGTVTAVEETSIVAGLDRAHPDHRPVADLPALTPVDIKAVAQECRPKAPPTAREGRSCRLRWAVTLPPATSTRWPGCRGRRGTRRRRPAVHRPRGDPGAGRGRVIGGKPTVVEVTGNRPGYQRPGSTGDLAAHYAFTVTGPLVVEAELGYARWPRHGLRAAHVTEGHLAGGRDPA